MMHSRSHVHRLWAPPALWAQHLVGFWQPSAPCSPVGIGPFSADPWSSGLRFGKRPLSQQDFLGAGCSRGEFGVLNCDLSALVCMECGRETWSPREREASSSRKTLRCTWQWNARRHVCGASLSLLGLTVILEGKCPVWDSAASRRTVWATPTSLRPTEDVKAGEWSVAGGLAAQTLGGKRESEQGGERPARHGVLEAWTGRVC